MVAANMHTHIYKIRPAHLFPSDHNNNYARTSDFCIKKKNKKTFVRSSAEQKAIVSVYAFIIFTSVSFDILLRVQSVSLIKILTVVFFFFFLDVIII